MLLEIGRGYSCLLAEVTLKLRTSLNISAMFATDANAFLFCMKQMGELNQFLRLNSATIGLIKNSADLCVDCPS